MYNMSRKQLVINVIPKRKLYSKYGALKKKSRVQMMFSVL